MYSFTLSRCGLSTCIKALIDWLVVVGISTTKSSKVVSKVVKPFLIGVLKVTTSCMWQRAYYYTFVPAWHITLEGWLGKIIPVTMGSTSLTTPRSIKSYNTTVKGGVTIIVAYRLRLRLQVHHRWRQGTYLWYNKWGTYIPLSLSLLYQTSIYLNGVRWMYGVWNYEMQHSRWCRTVEYY